MFSLKDSELPERVKNGRGLLSEWVVPRALYNLDQKRAVFLRPSLEAWWVSDSHHPRLSTEKLAGAVRLGRAREGPRVSEWPGDRASSPPLLWVCINGQWADRRSDYRIWK